MEIGMLLMNDVFLYLPPIYFAPMMVINMKDERKCHVTETDE